ncbi:MAG: tRNA (N(6)-L-threonylcarbamoyladenosine(37)-C(2))-methylthiotransferase MtaB [Ruthenibacterium sp.]
MKVAFYTLGCKVNQNETGALTRLFCENGFVLAQEDEAADVYVVNSCTVTAGGDKKSRQWLRRVKRKNPNAVTVLTGCYPQAFPTQAAAAMEADVVTGSSARGRILANVLRSMRTGERIVDIVQHERTEIFEELPMEQMTDRNRAFMKIEDGCNRQCAYCVIPRARGSVRSRSEASILAELHALAADGVPEVVFSGINLSSYGRDTGTCLADIVEKAAQIEGIRRIRLGSLEPDLMDDASLSRLASVPKLCPQFHLALQSGCDATLRRMRRIYTVQEYRALVQKIRVLIPHATFITDMIVGFPGETDEDFLCSMRFAEEIGFLKVHVFSYSRREGTPAYAMPQQIDAQVKAQRSHVLQAAADAMRARIIAGLRGTQAEVLLEKRINASVHTGYTREYIPVLVSAPQHTQGDIVAVTLGDFDGERCAAVLSTD